MKKFNKFDTFGIHQSLWISSVLFFVCETISLCAAVVLAAWYWYDEHYWIIYYYWQTFFIGCVLYAEIPSIKHLRRQKENEAAIIIGDVDKNKPDIHWTDIVSTVYGYTSLMNHLESEYSIENLLYLTEYMQIKDILLKNNPTIVSTIQNNNKGSYFNIKIPDGSQSFGNFSLKVMVHIFLQITYLMLVILVMQLQQHQ